MKVSISQYAMSLAKLVATRSEDPYRQVGAVAMDEHGIILSTGYNGTQQGFKEIDWSDREAREKYIIHAEINCLCRASFGKVHTLAVTTSPCLCCTKLILAHKIQFVYYHEVYISRHQNGQEALSILSEHGVHLEQI